MYAFERFTERAKKTLTLAQEEAQQAGHSYIGTEHLLLGLLREGEGLAYRVLNDLGVEIAKVREAIETVLSREERIIIQQIIPTARVKKVIEISFDEALRMGHNYVGTEHLLLGLMIEGEGIAAHVLQDLGVTLDGVRAEINRQLAGGAFRARRRLLSEPAHASEWMSHVREGMRVIQPGGLALGPDAGEFLRFASALATSEGAAAVGLEHLQRAMGDPAIQSLLQQAARVRQATAAKEEAIARQDHEAAEQRRQEERQLKDECAKAESDWRASLDKPAGGMTPGEA